MVESRIRPSWQPALARMCFVLLLCLLMPDRLFAGNCTQLAAETMTRAGVSATIKGFYVLVQPLDQTGSALPNVYIELNLTTLSEREKVYDWINGSIIEQADGGVQCNDPQQPIFGGDLALLDSCALTGACYVDALQNLGPTFDCGNEQPCGNLLQAIFTADLNCWQEHLYDQPYYSIHLEEVVVHFSDPKSNFSGTVAYVIPDNDYAYSYPPLTFNYIKNSIKVQYDFYNWPWLGSSDYVLGRKTNNASYVSLWFNSSYIVPHQQDAVIAMYNGLGDGATHQINYTNPSYYGGELNISLQIQGGYIVDTVPQLQTTNLNNLTIDGAFDWHSGFVFNWNTQACGSSTGHWQHYLYDPTLTVFFSGTVPTPGKSSKVIEIAVPVSLVGLALIIGGLIALSRFNPAFKKLAQPFSGRSSKTFEANTQQSMGRESAPSSDWTAGRKDLASVH